MSGYELDGKVAIVTGASRGLGLAAAQALLAEGVRVLAAARTAAALDALAAAHPGRVEPVACDMRDLDAVATLPATATERLGGLDILVNNAGIAPAGAFAEQSLETWSEVLDVNVLAPVALTRAAAGQLLGQGSGKVINVASTSGLLGKPTLAAYSASKGALLQFTKALAGEWAARGIQVNAIAPGAFETEAQQAVLDSPDVLARRLRKIPSGRMGQPDEIGALVCWLASSQSDFVNGATIVIDGGESSKL
jgi:2-dehydro-3-deoxy-D-gluconate 5-dehydrogenase